jgi:hypothetical protein
MVGSDDMAADQPDPQREIASVLMRNATFYRQGPDDETLYYVDPATLATFAFDIMQYVGTVFGATVPLIQGVQWLRRRQKARANASEPGADGAKGEQPRDFSAELEDASPEVLQQLLAAARAKLDDAKVHATIEQNIQEILVHHGWPAGEANGDASRIMSILKTQSA